MCTLNIQQGCFRHPKIFKWIKSNIINEFAYVVSSQWVLFEQKIYVGFYVKKIEFQRLKLYFQSNLMKTNENGLKTLSFNDKDKIKGKVNNTKLV